MATDGTVNSHELRRVHDESCCLYSASAVRSSCSVMECTSTSEGVVMAEEEAEVGRSAGMTAGGCR